MNSFGSLFRVTTFGESHGVALGAVIDGCPAGVPLQTDQIQAALDRRRPGQSQLTTPRAEADVVEVLSGVYQGKTLGTPIAAVVRNQDQKSSDYDALAAQDRPGHADRVWRERFKHRDHRGGGRTSARETLSRVIAGAVAEALLSRELPQLRIVAWVSAVGSIRAADPAEGLARSRVDAHPTRCPDELAAEQMSAAILAAKAEGDSLGGSVDLRVTGVPAGLGEPVFDKLKASFAHALGSVNAVSGVVWGDPSLLERLSERGSTFHQRPEVYGGIQGGLSNGEPILLRTFFKPPATLGIHARGGRHDPCVLPRAVPILEAMIAICLADAYLHFLAFPHRA